MVSGKYNFKQVNGTLFLRNLFCDFGSKYADVYDCNRGSCGIKMQLYDLIICPNNGILA